MEFLKGWVSIDATGKIHILTWYRVKGGRVRDPNPSNRPILYTSIGSYVLVKTTIFNELCVNEMLTYDDVRVILDDLRRYKWHLFSSFFNSSILPIIMGSLTVSWCKFFHDV